jgi:hypothetical protein
MTHPKILGQFYLTPESGQLPMTEEVIGYLETRRYVPVARRRKGKKEFIVSWRTCGPTANSSWVKTIDTDARRPLVDEIAFLSSKPGHINPAGEIVVDEKRAAKERKKADRAWDRAIKLYPYIA